MQSQRNPFKCPFEGRVRVASDGFALVLALLLMGFILLLLVGITSLAKVETATASLHEKNVKARMNALLGLQVALGSLQSAAGGDQRVTARADIFDENGTLVHGGNKFWTGIWDSRLHQGNFALPDDSLEYGSNRSSTDGRLPGYGASIGNENAPKWMVSVPDNVVLDPRIALVDHSGVNGVVKLVSETEVGEDDAVEAGLVELNDSREGSGRFAWWIGDEGVKCYFALDSEVDASWTVPNGSSNLLVQEMAANRQNFAAVGLLPGLDTVEPLDRSDSSRIFSFNDLAQLFPDIASDIESLENNYFHDLTTLSLGLLTDTRNGGLKIDLSRALEEQWPDFLRYLSEKQQRTSGGLVETTVFDGTEWAEPAPLFAVAYPEGYAPANSEENVEDGDRIYGPLWDVLYSYYHAYKPEQPYTVSLAAPTSGGNNARDNFYNWSYQGYSGRTLPEKDDWEEMTVLLHPFNTGDSVYTPTGLDSLYSLPGEIQAMSQGSALSGGMIPRARDYFGYMPDYQIDEVIRELSASKQSRGEPYWDTKTPVVVRAGMRLALSTTLEEPSKLDPNATATPSDASDDIYVLHLHLYPYFVLWNPYNVKLAERSYQFASEYRIPMQIYFDASGDGNLTRDELLLQNYVDGSTGPDNWTDIYNTFELDGHDHGVFLHRLIAMNAIENMTVTHLNPTPNRGDAYKRAQKLSFTSEPFEMGPGEFMIVTSKHDASILADGQGPEYWDKRYFDAAKISEASLDNSSFDSDKGFIVDLLAVADFGNRSPSGKTLGLPTDGNPNWHIAKPVPANVGADIWVRFYNEAYGSRDPSARESYRGQGDFNVNLTREDREVVVGSGSGDIIFLDPSESFSASDLTVRLGNPSLLNGNPSDFAWFGWQYNETEGGDLPLYSVLNPRSMENVDFLGRDADHPESSLVETFYELSTSPGLTYEPLVESGPEGRLLAHAGGSYSATGETSLVLYDVPRQPIDSVAGFMHANISFFDSFPSYMIGNGFASPYLDPREYASPVYNNALGRNVLLPDVSYLANDALFDSYFFSSIPVDLTDAPSVYGKYSQSFFEGLPPFDLVDSYYFESGKPLPNGRVRYLRRADQDASEFEDAVRDYKTAAGYLGVAGAFNVNSTSEDAWASFLGGVRALSDLAYYDTETGAQANSTSGDRENSFLRFGSIVGNDEWKGFRRLSNVEIESLAQAIVQEVKERGPFLSLSDFVNRRLVNGDLGKMGTLQAAINASGINNAYAGNGALDDAFDASQVPSSKAGLPGYLLQNDVLKTLASQMTVRSDTFKIRGYGECLNPLTGEVEGQALCEAVVQRFPDWVDSSDNVENEVYSADFSSALAPLNDRFGRRFKVVAFRWLNIDEM